MTYDELYNHVVNYVAMPHTTITHHDQRRAIDVTDFVSGKLDELEGK